MVYSYGSRKPFIFIEASCVVHVACVVMPQDAASEVAVSMELVMLVTPLAVSVVWCDLLDKCGRILPS